MKWSFVPRNSPKPKYIVVNGDEGEPGTCKDRVLIENDPHQLIEGVLIAALAVEAHAGWVYIRGEYRYLIDIHGAGHRGGVRARLPGEEHPRHRRSTSISTRTPGAGAYECGEESALLESLEGKRGVPRIRPPFPAVVGAFQCPTVLNNVETFCAVPAIIRDGGAAFAALGIAQERRHAAVLPLGARQQAGRLRAAHGVQPAAHDRRGGRRRARRQEAEGGDSGRLVVPGADARTSATCPMDFDSLAKAKSMLGSGGVIVMDEDTCMVRAAATRS